MSAHSRTSNPSITCNPVNLPYRYQHFTAGPWRRVSREGADPSIIMFRGRLFLFMSMAGGFWHSKDMTDWSFVPTPTLPIYDYAPDVREVDGALVVCASHATMPGKFFRTADPLSGIWEEIPGTVTIWDPNLFQDDDGRLYLYWGCSNTTPIFGAELNRTTFTPIGEPVSLIQSDTARRGWERTGVDHNPARKLEGLAHPMPPAASDAPYIEGAWMTKHKGRYYLQYSAPGTELNTYADGYFVGETPLGPFTYSPHSPFSSKPGGFMTAAGHGSTFQDRHGNWWHTATMRISRNHIFERRIGIFPAGFDADGVLFCNQEFADYPMSIPDGPADPWSLSGQSMLLSFKCSVTASSASTANPASCAVDEDARTWWTPADAQPGHWLQLDLGDTAVVESVQVNFADHDIQAPHVPPGNEAFGWTRYIDLDRHPVEYLLEGSADARRWEVLSDTREKGRDLGHDLVKLPAPTPLRFIRLTLFAQPFDAVPAISGLRVFGRGTGSLPSSVTPKAVRQGPLNALIEWHPVAGAQGYNVRYGINPDKLYSSWMVYDQTQLDLSALNDGSDYWVAVDAFNANGVTRGPVIAIQNRA